MTPEELQAALDAEKAAKEKLEKELEELRKKNVPPVPKDPTLDELLQKKKKEEEEKAR